MFSLPLAVQTTGDAQRAKAPPTCGELTGRRLPDLFTSINWFRRAVCTTMMHRAASYLTPTLEIPPLGTCFRSRFGISTGCVGSLGVGSLVAMSSHCLVIG